MPPIPKNVSTEEEINELISLENSKKKELDEKKAELEKKKKELEELEKERAHEIASSRRKIEEKIEELSVEEQRSFEELEELRKKREEQARSLEEAIAGEGTVKRQEEVPAARGYGEAINEIIRGNAGFYEVTNYNVLNQLEMIASQAASRSLTENEKNFVEIVQYHAEQLQKDDFYKNKDGSNYLRRELAKIDLINKIAKKSGEETRDYEP
jgi:hypothetical protein